jgi:hypothetical protein
MPVFVHLAAQKSVPAILRNGLAPHRRRQPRGVFAMPVTRNFAIRHQWLRELKRRGQRPLVGIYFRLSGHEPVAVGRYNLPHTKMTAADAVALLWHAEYRCPACARRQDEKSRTVQQGRRLPASPEGYEVIVPRRVGTADIIRVRMLPQSLGWRYYPGSHEKPPCICLCCERGQYGVGKLRRAVEEAESRNRPTKVILFGRQ